MDLNPVLAHAGGAVILDARVVIDPALSEPRPRYGHMAIHPYPTELEGEIVLRDGSRLPVRPIRPDDAERENRFFASLSERYRYQRFMHHVHRLSPQLLARFTQLDYDRELAIVALKDDEFVAVGRYAPTSDGLNAEFALTVADAWQGKGIGRALLERLSQEAGRAGYQALEGAILDANRDMLQLAAHLGFTTQSRDGEEVKVVKQLRSSEDHASPPRT